MRINEVGDTPKWQKKKINEAQLTNIISNVINESIKRYLKEECDKQELCGMIKRIYKSVSLRYRMQEYEEVFKAAINNGCTKQELIDAFKQCNLDCTTNPRSKKRFDEIWNSLGGSNGEVGPMSEGNNGLGDDEYIDEPEDDWRSEEPSEDKVRLMMNDIEKNCNEVYKLKFRDLGNGEFGVMCNAGSDADIKGFMEYMDFFVEQRLLNKLGVGTTDNGIWHAKFKIIDIPAFYYMEK